LLEKVHHRILGSIVIMPLQRIEPNMSTTECASVWDEWLEFFNQTCDYAATNPEQAKTAWASFVQAWHAAHDGVMYSERAIERLMQQELEAMPLCPFEEGTELYNVWCALEFAKSIRDHRSIIELSRKLTTLTMRSTPTPRVRQPQRDEED
jgi:hypothetical protein